MDLIINNRDNYEHLDIEKFSKCLLNPDACYKFYWLEAILNNTFPTSETISTMA